MAERKKLADMDILSSLADTDYVTIEHNGAMGRYSFADFKEAVNSESEKAMSYCDVMIAYHRVGASYNYSRLSKLADWPALQADGNTADGVAIGAYGHTLVVAPTEADSRLAWAPTSGAADTLFADLRTAATDMDGEGHTEKIIAAQGTGTDYAAGFCHGYSRLNSDGNGYGAGKWWLPSLGELFLLYAYREKIDYAMSLITGAALFQSTYYWASTEVNATNGWCLNLSTGIAGPSTKASSTYVVRPVTAFQD